MKTVFILLDNFYPAYKGGGPIQSITNLIISLQDEYNIYVVTSAYDLQSKDIMPGINPDAWNEITLPGASKSIHVLYAGRLKPGYKTFKELIKGKKPDCVYMNGIFSYNFFLLPLIAINNSGTKTKIIICPRGMLQKGALADKSIKKKVYLKILNLSGLLNKSVWHATNSEEKEDILKHFAINKGIVIAMNIPKKPLEHITFIEKLPGSLQLIYLSLVTEKKNLFYLLQLIKATTNISLDIYGPIKDKVYWKECSELINKMPDKVRYNGDVKPAEVQNIFAKYHSSVLLTKGENFGHALYESLSVGRPIITSYFTPWNDLQNLQAGWNLDINDPVGCISVLKEIIDMPQKQYDGFCIGAYELSKTYFNSLDAQKSYGMLFGVDNEN